MDESLTVIGNQSSAEATEFERRKAKFESYTHSPEYQAKLIQRLQINDACNRKVEARAMTWNLCARPDNPVEGCIFFIENFGFTFDPRPHANPNHLPFILFEYQKEAIAWLISHIDNGRDGLIEKSRDMGISWVVFVWVGIWYWLFRDGVNILLGSYKEALVDNRTKDSLFGMIDYGIESLPNWLLPKGFNKDKHRTQMKLVNPVNSNLITGDTMNPDFARGARKTAVLFDELGSWDYAKDAWESAGDSTSCRIANSTPKGYNFYAMLRNSGIDVLTLHWKLHPLKDMDWYEFEKSRRTEEEVAQELDISYNKSQEGRVYPEWNDVNVIEGFFPYDDAYPLYIGWDFGATDDTAIIWMQKIGHRWRIVDVYRNTGKTIDFYIPFITGIVSSDSYSYTKKDLEMIGEHKNWKKGIHFGDPAGRFTNQVTNTSVLEVLRNNGIFVNFNDAWKEFQKRKTAAKLLMQDGIDLHMNERTKYFSVCMANAAYPKVKVQGVDNIRSQKPKHDYTCLAGDTEIRTMDGWKKIKDLEGKQNFWVWGYSHAEGRLVPTLASKCWMTYEKAELLEIGLDNNISIKVTPNHRMMMRDGSYKKADEILVGESLMPFYERNDGGYIGIDLNDGTYAKEHQFVYSKVNGQIPIDYHIDHINGIKTDNRPENLIALSPNEHCAKTFRGKTMDERRKMGDDRKPYITKYSRSEIYRDCLHCGKEFKSDHKTFYCDKKCTSAAYRKRNSGLVNREKNKLLYKNHKVRFIKKIQAEAVYDIETPELHNFVANGVVVHNSHFRSAFEYLALGLENLQTDRKTPYDKFKKKEEVKQRGTKRRIIGY